MLDIAGKLWQDETIPKGEYMQATFIDYNGRTDKPFTLEFNGTPSLKYDGLWDNGRTPNQVAQWNDEDSCWFVYANSGNYSDVVFGVTP